MIKNIIFDISGVIWKGNHSAVLNYMDLDDDKKNEIEDKYFKTWKNIDLGYEEIETHFNNTKFSFNIDEKYKDMLINYYKYRKFNYDILNLISNFKSNNYKVYILSNNNKDAIKYLKDKNVLNVDGYVISCDCHLIKPDKKIYKELFNKYNLKPNECYFIDDRKENILVAKTLSMHGFVFDNNVDDLINDLRKKGVKIDR